MSSDVVLKSGSGLKSLFSWLGLDY